MLVRESEVQRRNSALGASCGERALHATFDHAPQPPSLTQHLVAISIVRNIHSSLAIDGIISQKRPNPHVMLPSIAHSSSSI